MNRPPEVDTWIAELAPADREIYEAVESVILSTGLVDEIVYSYKLPTFKHGKLPVTVATWKGGISLAARSAAPIEAFRAKHPEITGGKISVQFRRDAELPIDDLAELVRAALMPPS